MPRVFRLENAVQLVNWGGGGGWFVESQSSLYTELVPQFCVCCFLLTDSIGVVRVCDCTFSTVCSECIFGWLGIERLSLHATWMHPRFHWEGTSTHWWINSVWSGFRDSQKVTGTHTNLSSLVNIQHKYLLCCFPSVLTSLLQVLHGKSWSPPTNCEHWASWTSPLFRFYVARNREHCWYQSHYTMETAAQAGGSTRSLFWHWWQPAWWLD